MSCCLSPLPHSRLLMPSCYALQSETTRAGNYVAVLVSSAHGSLTWSNDEDTIHVEDLFRWKRVGGRE